MVEGVGIAAFGWSWQRRKFHRALRQGFQTPSQLTTSYNEFCSLRWMANDAKCQHRLALMTQTINFLFYQVGWFACVLGAACHRPWLGVAVALSFVCLHMMLTTDRLNQARLLFAALSVGVVVDTLLLMLGVYGFTGGSIVDWLPPVWMSVLWIQFATTFRYCLAWLSGRYALCSIAALIGAPLAFLGGERLGAVSFFSPRITNLLILGTLWAVALPMLIFVSDRIHANAADASYLRFSAFWRRQDFTG